MLVFFKDFMEDIGLEDFDKEIECFYERERYSVRNNGAVLRHPKAEKPPRPNDNNWTFGKPNEKTGYMEISSVRVHRIVAMAFLGEPPTKEHVVDHIDTNRKNNRPENLRWLTRLENVLKNPFTIKRIELACGSLEAFLANPSILRESKFDPNFKWMRNVSREEAQICLKNMQNWAKSDAVPSGGTLGEWVFKEEIPSSQNIPETTEEDSLSPSETLGAVQRDWSTKTAFPCCPQKAEGEPIKIYAENLKIGEVFCTNEYQISEILDFSAIDNCQAILVMCINKEKKSIKPWTLAKITYENGLYVHTGLGSFFEENGVRKQFCLEQGLKWTGEDSIDDYL